MGCSGKKKKKQYNITILPLAKTARLGGLFVV